MGLQGEIRSAPLMATWYNTAILSHEGWDWLFRHHIQLPHVSSADNHA